MTRVAGREEPETRDLRGRSSPLRRSAYSRAAPVLRQEDSAIGRVRAEHDTVTRRGTLFPGGTWPHTKFEGLQTVGFQNFPCTPCDRHFSWKPRRHRIRDCPVACGHSGAGSRSASRPREASRRAPCEHRPRRGQSCHSPRRDRGASASPCRPPAGTGFSWRAVSAVTDTCHRVSLDQAVLGMSHSRVAATQGPVSRLRSRDPRAGTFRAERPAPRPVHGPDVPQAHGTAAQGGGPSSPFPLRGHHRRLCD